MRTTFLTPFSTCRAGEPGAGSGAGNPMSAFAGKVFIGAAAGAHDRMCR
jgi:hypothetical protein